VKIIKSADAREIFDLIQKYDLHSSGLGEWAGNVDGEQVHVILISRFEAQMLKLAKTAESIEGLISSTKNGSKEKLTRPGLLERAKNSDWF